MLNEKHSHIVAKKYLYFELYLKKKYEIWFTVKTLTGKESNG